MSRPLKLWKYKDQGGSLAQYHKGEYVGSIPHHVLYQLIQERKGNGKAEHLVKPVVLKERAAEVGSGKESRNESGGAGP